MLLYCTETNEVTDEMYKSFFDFADDERKAKIKRYRQHGDKVLSAVSYVLLRYALHINGYDGTYSIVYNEYGKPFFEDKSVFFNISHTKGAVACAVKDIPVGVDIQKKVGNYEAVMRRVCTDREKEAIAVSADPCLEFTTLWTLKESILKCIGTGIAGTMTKYDFSENKTENGKYKLVTICDGENILSACAQTPFSLVKKITVRELYEFCKSKQQPL